ncbi:MAG TPA: hypothetical protein VMW15_03565, partial [Terracidiphilus sp.]|nr:hypothetical protein [Terracidiphilus sp.]
MFARVLKSVSQAVALMCVATMPVALAAQNAAKTAKGTSADSPSRWDIFAGYSYLAPKGTVQVPLGNGVIIPASYNAVNVGGLFSGAYFFNKYVGGQVEYDFHEWGTQRTTNSNIGTQGNNDGFMGFAIGPIFRYPTGEITPFVHGLVGTSRIDGPYHNPFRWGPTLTVGGGMDYETPLLNHRLA